MPRKKLQLPPRPPKRKPPKNVKEAIANYEAKAFHSRDVPPTPAVYKKKVQQIKDEWKVKAQMAKDEAEEKARQKKLAEEAKKKPKPTPKKKPAPKRRGVSINRRKARR